MTGSKLPDFVAGSRSLVEDGRSSYHGWAAPAPDWLRKLGDGAGVWPLSSSSGRKMLNLLENIKNYEKHVYICIEFSSDTENML